jgi:hypothetical protein
VRELARWSSVVGSFEGAKEEGGEGTCGSGGGGGVSFGGVGEEERKKIRETARFRVMYHLTAALEASDGGRWVGEGGLLRSGGGWGVRGLSGSLLGEGEWGDLEVLGARGVCMRRLGQLEEECAADAAQRSDGAAESWLVEP